MASELFLRMLWGARRLPGRRGRPGIFRVLLRLFLLVCLLPLPMAWGETSVRDEADTLRVTGASRRDATRLPSGWSLTRTSNLEIQYPPGAAVTVRWLEREGDAILLEVAEQLEFTKLPPLVVRLAPDRETFRQAQPGRPPEWAGGTAYPGLQLMVLLTRPALEWMPGQGVEKTFRHELVHLVLAASFHGRQVPRFLDEGLARLLAYEASVEEFGTLTRAVAFGGLIPFRELEHDFPSDPVAAEIAYAQSRHFLSYLTTRFGPQVLPALLERMREGESLNESLWQVVQQGLTGLEQDWRDELKRTHAWVPVLFGGLSLWTIMAVLVVVGAIRRRRKSRARRLAWEREEAALDAALLSLEGRLTEASPPDDVTYTPAFFQHGPTPGDESEGEPGDRRLLN